MQDMLSGISMSGIMSSFIFGVIGIWMLRQGKRNANYATACFGFSLMIYPYFTSGPLADWGVGFALCGLAYYFW